MEERDKNLWQIAKQRVAFKTNVMSYVCVNLFLIGVWYFTKQANGHNYFWPIWPILGWGLGLLLHGVKAYGGVNLFSVEKEFEKLKNL